jgi:hypothetical protein
MLRMLEVKTLFYKLIFFQIKFSTVIYKQMVNSVFDLSYARKTLGTEVIKRLEKSDDFVDWGELEDLLNKSVKSLENGIDTLMMVTKIRLNYLLSHPKLQHKIFYMNYGPEPHTNTLLISKLEYEILKEIQFGLELRRRNKKNEKKNNYMKFCFSKLCKMLNKFRVNV